MEYLEAWGTLIHEKNLKSKISCQTPFKGKIGLKYTASRRTNVSSQKKKHFTQGAPGS
jgi:hypothetical protein